MGKMYCFNSPRKRKKIEAFLEQKAFIKKGQKLSPGRPRSLKKRTKRNIFRIIRKGNKCC